MGQMHLQQNLANGLILIMMVSETTSTVSNPTTALTAVDILLQTDSVALIQMATVGLMQILAD